MSGAPGGFSAAEMNEKRMEALMAAPMKVSCDLCRWTAEGEAGKVLERQRRHRLRRHGIEVTRKSNRTVRHLGSFRQPYLTDEDRKEIEYERQRRLKLHGID